MEFSDSKMFFNRELSWLRFNTRVLNEAHNETLPLLERIKFLAIYGTNLDEFYMIRVAGLKRLYGSGVAEIGADRLTPLEQLRHIRDYLHQEQKTLEALFHQIRLQLSKAGLMIKKFSELNKTQKLGIKDYFQNYLYPIIVPIVVDATHPFPHLNNLSFGIAVKLKSEENGEIKYGMIRIPRILTRFVEVDKGLFVPVETIVGEFAGDLFEGYELEGYAPFRVTRNADIEIEEDEADDFIELMSEGLKARKKGEIVRLEVGSGDRSLLEFVKKQIIVEKEDIYENNMPLNLATFWELVGCKDFAHLSISPFNPKILPPLDCTTCIFDTIDKQDLMLFHPYESFDSVVNFIQSAAKDPDVLSIRMTLYRVGKNSPIIKALTEAAENKQVTVLVELKARFDEENNLHWAKALESAGAHVIYGVPGLKVHAKVALVIKKVGDKLKEYVHLSTGNYNVASAKIYTDVSLFTSNKEIANDVIKLFHSLSTGTSHKTELNALCVAPVQIKPKIISLIENEIKHGSKGRIILKANALVDADIIRCLYRASEAGVKIDLIIRGICCLRPNVKGFSENIRVFSIIGKYLEHARIYYFAHSNPQVYFSSADLMPRNLEKRVELFVPATSELITKRLVEILNIQLSDNVQMHELKENGEYHKVSSKGKAISSQLFYEGYVNEIYNVNKIEQEHFKAKKLLERMIGES
ncbi:RNA degradosome polyphosphate kinase [Helicobacter sp. 12S02232-10]|uniref:RNA degradosome polyphosphate kinase n=1 Tax=Helicobacter sp. 12S02232-10 TaxID=1476197 RepID=UPI000BA74779|nr:RNA degradosome polyphosphate kinase [Helicobacter sp. 12S02232-10]PAF47667.1 RNA degradosome polyphosphate kinase [Helicobacter sp. 12S02232-10]